MNEKTERAEGTPEPPLGGGEPKPPLAEKPTVQDVRVENYPRMVFRPGHMCRVLGRHDVDYMTVGSDKALEDALGHGWSVDPERMGGMEPKSEADKRRQQEREREEGRDTRQTGRGLRSAGGSGGREARTTDPEHVLYDPYKDPTNPRPGEPDNAPFRNTPYGEPQLGELAEPPTSPAEMPSQEELDPVIEDQQEAKERSGGTPGLEADEDRLKRDKDGRLIGLKDDKDRGGARDDKGGKIEVDEKSREKAADKLKSENESARESERSAERNRDAGRDTGTKDAPAKGGSADQDDKALRDKGAPPGAKKA